MTYKNNKLNKFPFLIFQITFDNNFTPSPNFLEKKYEDNEIIIFGYNKINISNFMKKNNIKSIFVPISDVLIHKNKTKNEYNIILMNKHVAKIFPAQIYEKVIKFGNGYLWKAKNISYPSILTNIGLIYSKIQPTEYYLIDTNYVIDSMSIDPIFNNSHLIVCNDFNMFTLEHGENKTIDLQKLTNFLHRDEIIHKQPDCPSLTQQQNTKHQKFTLQKIHEGTLYSPLAGIVVMSNITCNDDVTKNIEHFESVDNVNYLQDGRVEVVNKNNAKCLTLDDNENVIQNDCVYSDDQEWIFNNGNIVNRKTGKCLNSKNIQQLKECKEMDNFINPSDPDVKYPRWVKKFGKNVILTASDNPWYLNKDTSLHVINEIPLSPIPNELKSFPKNYAVFTQQQLQKDNRVQPELGVEYFTNIKSNKNKLLLLICCTLLIIIITQIIYLSIK